jgi:hypothetical protein
MKKTRLLRTAVAAAALGGTMIPYTGLAGAEPGPTPYTYKQVPFKPQAVDVKKLTAASQMTKDQLAPARAFTGPTSMVAKPDDPRIVVAATADLRDKVCYLTVSRDAGRTWRFSKELPTDPRFPFCAQQTAGIPEAVVAWGSDGTLYYLHTAYGEGEGPSWPGKFSVLLARTKNLGESWQITMIDNARERTGDAISNWASPGLAIDTSGPRDVIYAGFSQSFPDAPEDSPLNAPRPMVATSTDGGATFSTPIDLNTFPRPTQNVAGKQYQLFMDTGFGSPFLVAHDGVVLAVAGGNFPSNDQPPPPPEAGTGLNPGSWYAHPMPQMIARSTDQGKTWEIKTLGDPILAGTGTYTGLGWTPKGGDNGTFVAVHAATPATSPTIALADIVVHRSTDGGVTWTSPLAIDDDPPEMMATGFYPQLNVSPNGRIDVAWQDNRETSDFHFDVRYTYSTDGGLTWAKNVKVNDRPNNFNYGVSFNSDLRQPNGVASADEYAIIGWADTRNANEVTQTQDNYAAGVQFEPLPTKKNTTAPIIAAIFGGLVVAGAVLLILQARKRRVAPAPAA